MSNPNKESPEVVKFMTLFSDLKLFSDDAPEDLVELAASDSSVEDLCTEIYFAADKLTSKERLARELFVSPANPDFIAAWRVYEDRYKDTVSNVFLVRLGLGDLSFGTDGRKPSHVPKADLQWKNADDDAAEQASGIKTAIDYAYYSAKEDSLGYDPTGHIEEVQDGIAAWDRLTNDTGFDLQGVFRRRALVPFVLVPRKVAAKNGRPETLSMLKNLQQAHDAFVFGATYAALALMRSIMEAVLRDHYRAEGKDLKERIQNARDRLPRDANFAALTRLRKLANAILHLDRERDQGLPKMNEVRLEKEIVSLLFVLRALIEGEK